MKVEFLPSAVKEFGSLPRNIQRQVATKISGLGNDPFPAYSKALKGEGAYRLRSGEYRVLYTVDNPSDTITTVKVRHRKDAYRNL